MSGLQKRVGSAIGAVARRARAQWSLASGRAARARARLDGSCAAVLMYHRVLPADEARGGFVESGMYVTPQSFSMHLDVLQELFRVLPLGEIVDRIREGKPLPPRAVAITFDDGWKDNWDHAAPLLAARGLPATVFVVTERVGSMGAFWPDEVSRRLAPLAPDRRRDIASDIGATSEDDGVSGVLDVLKGLDREARNRALARVRELTPAPGNERRELMSWDELESLARQGVAIESHGTSHEILTGVPEADAQRELVASRAALLERGFGCDGHVAYPSGAWNARVSELVGRVGYRAAFTTAVGLVSGSASPLALPRVGVHDDISSSRAAFLRSVPGRAEPFSAER